MSGGLARIFGTNESFVAGFLAIDDVVAWFYAHQELDAAVCAFEVVGGGFPDQLAILGYEKDVEGRDHGGGVISQAVIHGGTELDSRADSRELGWAGRIDLAEVGRSMLRPYYVWRRFAARSTGRRRSTTGLWR